MSKHIALLSSAILLLTTAFSGIVCAQDYPSATWTPAYSGNYETASRTSANIYWIVLHTTEGTASSAISWFQNAASGVSAHYLVRRDGTIVQLVRDKDIAYHAGNYPYNQKSIGIEHERYSTYDWTEAQFTASALLVNWLCDRYQISPSHVLGIAPASPTANNGVIGHYQVPDPNNPALGGGTNHKTDPVNWDWAHYEAVLAGGGLTRYITLGGTMAFGSVAVGSSAQSTLTIYNTGTGPLTVSGITYPSGFSGNWSGIIPSAGSHDVTVTFAPSSVTTYSGNITVNSDATDGVNTKAASGTGTASDTRIISLSGDLAFGFVQVGATATRTLTISNSGTGPLTVSGITYPTGFSGSWSGAIAAGASRNVTVTFAPGGVTDYGGSVTVNSDKTSGTNIRDISGSGSDLATRIISLSGNMDFGSVAVGSSATAVLTITNTGNSALTVSSINYPSGFSGNWSGGSIAAGGSRNVTVTFTPTASINYGGTITVNSDKTSGTNTRSASGVGTTSPTRTISLSGIMDFGSVLVGSSVEAVLTISNTGNSVLTVSGITFPSGFSGNWSGTIAAGSSHNVTVTFSPTAAIIYGGTITVNSDKTSGTNTRSASGTGTTIASPDLSIVGQVVVSPNVVAPGGTIRVDWTEKNGGQAASSPVHNTKLFLSDSIYGTTYMVGYFGPMPTLGIGVSASYNSGTYVVVPASVPPGNYYVTAFVDCDSNVPEGNELNNIGSSSPNKLTVGFSSTNRPTLDFDGDGKSDIGCYYAPGGNWYLMQSRDGFKTATFGYEGTVPVVGDFDGDGKTDYGCYYAPGGNWYLMQSREGFKTATFGYGGTVPVVGDFDGDGRTDYGCYYPPGGNWYLMQSSGGFKIATFGYGGTVPVVGDFDGDGKTDYGCYYAPGGNWYLMQSRDGFKTATFGYEGTVPVVGDFDGDGKTDYGCYYAPGGNWYLMQSREGFKTATFGYGGTVPVVGDFDGDGRTDYGCYYPPGGNWYLMQSSGGFKIATFGYGGTVPLGQ